jgi:hypothetical protein
VDWSHHVALAPLVELTCAEFGVPYHQRPSLAHAVASHLAHLRRLNNPAAVEHSGAPGGEGPLRGAGAVAELQASRAPDVTPQSLQGLAFLDQLGGFHYRSILFR